MICPRRWPRTARGGSKYINIHLARVLPTPQGALLVLAVGAASAEMFRSEPGDPRD